MINISKKIWETLEKEIGCCILYRDAAIKEMLEGGAYTLQFATFAQPEKVEAFFEKMGNEVRVYSTENHHYNFTMSNTRIFLTCYESQADFNVAYNSLFGQVLRCDNLGINFYGQIIRNTDAYKDIKAREIHFAKENFEFSEWLIQRITGLVQLNSFTIGEDIVEYMEKNKVFENIKYRKRFASEIIGGLRKKRLSWMSVAENLKLVKSFMHSNEDFINYTEGLTDEDKNEKFIRAYLYHLFIELGLSSKDLVDVLQNEPTLQYFDSIAVNIYACLGEYETYSDIKSNYGEEFLELLMDVQESISRCAGFQYQRVSDATFDIGKLFVKDERFWCSEEELNNPTEAENVVTEAEQDAESIDASKGNAGTWLDDSFNKKNYEDDESDERRIYVDDEVEEETESSGIDTSAFDSYETGTVKNDEPVDKTPIAKVEPKNGNQDIMNSQRGHESSVLNSGGM